MLEAKPISTPMVSTSKLSKHGSDTLTDSTFYRSVVGALQYATITRPEISFAVNKVCQFMASPLESHWNAVKRILRYLKGTLYHGLHIQAAGSHQKFQLHAFCGADWAADKINVWCSYLFWT
uniref:Retrovirus-related Pol polyprotein from transposon TNT 1-94 n=1 Tax=Cajanus cajan TaxID=3821 RepID=A0A151SVB9_CAJCA|nr:hypothetical protein KK1_014136 [Cajanus cajan]